MSILGVSTDTPEANLRFKKQQAFPFPLLCDTDRSISMAYGAAGFASAYYANRITYIIDENGIIRKVFPKVDVATHADDLVTYFATTPASA